jgi:hypothetical protein
MTVLRSTRAARKAGNNPNTSPVSTETKAVKASTRPSTPTAAPSMPMRGMLPGLSASKARMPTTPSARPNRPPSSDSTRLSVISWRAMRPRAAPIAARIAISRWRTVARTSSRLATFAHAINSTKLTAPTRIHSDDRTLRTIISCSVCTPNPTCGGSACGNAWRNSAAADASCAVPLSTETPGFRRPAVVKKFPCMVLLGSIWNGSQTSGAPTADCMAVVSNGPNTPMISCA